MLRELVELAKSRGKGYDVIVSFRENPRIHEQVPIDLYLRHFSNTNQHTEGGFVAGIDLNNDRINIGTGISFTLEALDFLK